MSSLFTPSIYLMLFLLILFCQYFFVGIIRQRMLIRVNHIFNTKQMYQVMQSLVFSISRWNYDIRSKKEYFILFVLQIFLVSLSPISREASLDLEINTLLIVIGYIALPLLIIIFESRNSKKLSDFVVERANSVFVMIVYLLLLSHYYIFKTKILSSIGMLEYLISAFYLALGLMVNPFVTEKNFHHAGGLTASLFMKNFFQISWITSVMSLSFEFKDYASWPIDVLLKVGSISILFTLLQDKLPAIRNQKRQYWLNHYLLPICLGLNLYIFIGAQ